MCWGLANDLKIFKYIMSTGVSIEGERESGKDVRDGNGKHGVIQCVLLCLSPTLSVRRWALRDWIR